MRDAHGRGQTLVEFALVLPIFILLMFGLFDLGRAVYAYNTISNAARSGARTAIVNQTEATVRARAIQESVSLGVTDADVTISYLQPATATACVSPINIGCRVQVAVEYTWFAATPIIGPIIGSVTMEASSEMPVERTCPYPPTLDPCP